LAIYLGTLEHCRHTYIRQYKKILEEMLMELNQFEELANPDDPAIPNLIE
jgi:hypothetical protein